MRLVSISFTSIEAYFALIKEYQEKRIEFTVTLIIIIYKVKFYQVWMQITVYLASNSKVVLDFHLFNLWAEQSIRKDIDAGKYPLEWKGTSIRKQHLPCYVAVKLQFLKFQLYFWKLLFIYDQSSPSKGFLNYIWIDSLEDWKIILVGSLLGYDFNSNLDGKLAEHFGSSYHEEIETGPWNPLERLLLSYHLQS